MYVDVDVPFNICCAVHWHTTEHNNIKMLSWPINHARLVAGLHTDA